MSIDAEKLKQKQKIRKYLVFTGMCLLFFGSLWLIFVPLGKDKQKAKNKTGFNTELPDPRGAGIEADKMAAYKQADMIRLQEEKKRTLADFSALADGHRQENVPETEPAQDIESENESRAYRSVGNDKAEAFASSASAYNDINTTLGSFYESPEEDPEKEALKAEVEQLRQTAATQTAGPSYEEQVALLEKSYELAAKYMPSGGSTGTAVSEETESPSREKKAKAVLVGQVSSPVVSSLPHPLTDSMQFARLLSGTNAGFHTAVGSAGTQRTKNTIRACVHGDQTVISGQSVRLRLLESMRVGSYVLPRNTLLTGEGRIQGERLGIEILQVEYDGTVIPVELTVLDRDGQDGIFIPGSTEANAVREVAANMGQNLGTTISITNQSAGNQLLSELGRGTIQGVSQYISKKMREEKVHLKSGYGLMLYQNNNQ